MTVKNLLLINGFGSATSTINELLSDTLIDINIYLSYPLGVLTLAGWVRQELPDYNIQILDVHMDLHKAMSNINRVPMDVDGFIAQELNKVHFVPDYIGISMSFSNGHVACLKMIDICKERWQESKVITGGMHATTFASRIILDPNIDFIIRGPGDISFIELLKALEGHKSPENILGVVTGLNNIDNFGLRLENLDAIPPYPYDLIDMEYLVINESTSPVYEKGIRTGLVLISRGCPFSCSFCSASNVHGKKIFYKSVHRVLSEIEDLISNYKVNQLCIMDDLFGADKKYFYNLFAEVERRNLKVSLVIPGGLSLVLFNEAMIDVLVKYGLKAVNFPLESGSQYVQENILKKHIDLVKAAQLISYAKGKGLFVGVNIVIGLPGETQELVNETSQFIKKLPVDWTSLFVAYPYPGTRMTEILFERGELTNDKLIEIWESSAQGFKPRIFDTKEFSGKELSEEVYNLNIELNFFSNYNMRTKNYRNMLLKLHKIIERYPFHVVALACRSKCYYELGETQKATEDVASINKLIMSNIESEHMYLKYKDKIEEAICSEGGS